VRIDNDRYQSLQAKIFSRAAAAAAPATECGSKVYARKVPADDELCAIDFLNDSEERSRSPVEKFAEEVVEVRERNSPGH